MAIFKCKMCGGDLEINEGVTVCDCDYCGTKQTVPTAKDENLHGLYNRANTLRIKAEFDKAEQLYEKILQADESQAEAYWGLILCKYGIEYVEDPATFKRVPTCHRTSFDSIVSDEDYKSALTYADAVQKSIYEQEAKEIDRIQKEIIEFSSKEEPYDVFICYKETDETGSRTQDSVIANDIYYQLTQEGFKVFYAAITLEDKLGSAYEPCIFAALNSAKVMLAIGTKPEYFSAVWVKNEWSRFLKLMKKDRSKLLIPCYKDIDAYDLPDEFAHLQAQDMGKIGFINDVVRGIKKVIVKDVAETGTPAKANEVNNANTAPLLERAFMFLEDGEFDHADKFCEQVLNLNPKCAMAYVGKLMVDLNVCKMSALKNLAESFDENLNYQKAMRFGDDNLKNQLRSDIDFINNRNLESDYNSAIKAMNLAKTKDDYYKVAEQFEKIDNYKDSEQLADDCFAKAEEARKNETYDSALTFLKQDREDSLDTAIKMFESIKDWKDSSEKIAFCNQRIAEINKLAEEARLDAERLAEQQRLEEERIAEQKRIEKEKRKKRTKAITVISTSVVCITLVVAFVLTSFNFNPWNNIKTIKGGCYISNDNTIISMYDYYNDWTDIVSISSTHLKNNLTVALKNNGTVVANGNNNYGQCDVSDWTDIVAVTAGCGEHTVGLKSDGTVVAVGNNDMGQCNVSGWTDIVAVSAGWQHTVGVKRDGTIVFAGDDNNTRFDILDWTNIKTIFEDNFIIVGIKNDNTVVAKGVIFGDDEDVGQCDVSDWTNIVAVDTGRDYTVGLRSDGTVVATGKNNKGQCDVSDWTDIVAISADFETTVGLKSDGTVVVTGEAKEYEDIISTWTDVVAVEVTDGDVSAVKSDGTAVATSGYSGGAWKGFFGNLMY